MEEDPAARKARLKALKAAAAASQQQQQDQPQGQGAAAAAAPEEGPALRFRNYNVKDTKRIVHEQVAPAQPPKLEEPVIDHKPEDADQEELLSNIAPKKPNWDLKRDLQGRLDKLERRTQRAVVEIMREEEKMRLEEEGGVQD